jgi:hypothetical protein
MKTSKAKTKKVKAWFVELFPTAKKEVRFFSGEAFKNQARIYSTKKMARIYWPEPDIVIYPCTITYSLPPKPKKK